MLLQKRRYTRGVYRYIDFLISSMRKVYSYIDFLISSMRKSIYLLTTTPSSQTHRFHPLPLATPTSHTHTFHPLSTIVIHTLNFAQVKIMDDNCGEWVECMGVASVVSMRRVWLVGVDGIYGCGCKEVYRLLHSTYPYSSCFCSFLQQHPYFLFILYIQT